MAGGEMSDGAGAGGGSGPSGGGGHAGAGATGLRAVALFEALKGAVVLVAGSGLFLLVRPEFQAWAEQVAQHSHLNPARNYPRIFLEAVGRGDGLYLTLAAGALVYATARFVEAFGLWRGKSWAQWFALASGALYLPLEAMRFWEYHHLLTAGIFLLNAGVVLFLAALRWGRTRFRG